MRNFPSITPPLPPLPPTLRPTAEDDGREGDSGSVMLSAQAERSMTDVSMEASLVALITEGAHQLIGRVVTLSSAEGLSADLALYQGQDALIVAAFPIERSAGLLVRFADGYEDMVLPDMVRLQAADSVGATQFPPAANVSVRGRGQMPSPAGSAPESGAYGG